MRPRAPVSRFRQTFSGCSLFAVIGCGIVSLSTFLCCGGVFFYGWRAGERARNELAEADRLWAAGQKAQAVNTYKAALKRDLSGIPSDAEKPVMYQRVIDFELEQGDTDAARASAEQAAERNVTVAPGSPATNSLVTLLRAERERKQADAQAQKEAAARRREEERANAPRVTVELVTARIEPFRLPAGFDTKLVATDWKNTGNRPVRSVSATIKAFDANGSVVYTVPDYVIYATGNGRPGVAPGETYTKPKGEGYALPKDVAPTVTRVTVEITKASETGY